MDILVLLGHLEAEAGFYADCDQLPLSTLQMRSIQFELIKETLR